MLRVLGIVLTFLTMSMPLLAHGAFAKEDAAVQVASNAEYGAILTDAAGKTLYLFTMDTKAGESTCSGDCATAWPPVPATDMMALPEGVPGELTAIDRADGSKQLAYNDIPLYTYAADDEAGDVYGEAVGGVWFVVHPGSALGPYAAAPGEGTPVPAAALNVGFTEDLGPYLTDAKGMTVYLFTKDTKAGESACDASCAANWPPVPGDTMMTLPAGVQGTLGTIDRAEGGTQLTYNDIPLYFFAKDTKAGETNGQDVGDVWYVVTPGMKLGDEPHEEEGEHEEMAEATPAS